MLAPMEISIDMTYTFWFIACIGRLSLHAPFFIPNGLCAPTPCTAGERASPRITSEYVQWGVAHSQSQTNGPFALHSLSCWLKKFV